MTPTNKLRWIEREHEVGIAGIMVQIETVLQQWWVSPNSFDTITGRPAGEWRDVPLEEEK